ncbi:MAG: MFS transporter [Ponticaulis sp.]|nr:MFS transporter [Ponticaulis sp.]|tara:strand:+ start:12762 stop:14069 length:1308 start_codon:yes stop_codon:yes gene_type:complete
MTERPADILATERMSMAQIVVIALCVLLNAIDGFDVLSISFASPGISAEWGISRGALGIVLSMELIGMAVGSILLGQVADRVGRRPVIIGCLLIMASGMYLASTANGIEILSAFRLFTGLGIGGMLACTNAMVAEYSNDKYRSLNVTLMAAGYPIGAIVGGAIASQLLVHFDWRAVFLFGCAFTICLLPAVYFLMPESVSNIASRRPENALEKVNSILVKLGHNVVAALPEPNKASGGVGISRLFGPDLFKITLVLTLAYFAHIMTFYYILKWIPKLVVDMGFVASEAGNVLVWANVGGAIGGVLLGVLTRKFDVRWLTIGILVFSFLLVTLFGRGQADLQGLSIASAAAGFFTNAGVVGLYALLAAYFPANVRAGGTGFVIGVGRGGAALGPIIAGYLFETGQGLQLVSILMAMGSIIALIALLFLGSKSRATS